MRGGPGAAPRRKPPEELVSGTAPGRGGCGGRGGGRGRGARGGEGEEALLMVELCAVECVDDR
jgi:hypothetical protein